MYHTKSWKDVLKMSNAKVDGFPDGIEFVLPFLDLRSLLNIEGINKALKEALKDPFLWVDLTIDWLEAHKLTNENLLKLVERADGHLKSLFLDHTSQITNETLGRIFELNPRLERISVLTYQGLDDEKLVSLVEAHSLRAWAKGLPGITEVSLRRVFRADHRVRLLVALELSRLPRNEASLSDRYYGRRQGHSEAIDKQLLDVELCPKCPYMRLMYDGSNHNHQLKDDGYIEESSSKAEYFKFPWKDDFKNCKSCKVHIAKCEQCVRESIYTDSSNYRSDYSDYSDYSNYSNYSDYSDYGLDYLDYELDYGADFGANYRANYEDIDCGRYPGLSTTLKDSSDVIGDAYPKENHHFNRHHHSRTAHECSNRVGSNLQPKQVRSGRDGKDKHQSPMGSGSNLRSKRVRSGRDGKGKHQSPLSGPLGLADIHLEARI